MAPRVMKRVAIHQKIVGASILQLQPPCDRVRVVGEHPPVDLVAHHLGLQLLWVEWPVAAVLSLPLAADVDRPAAYFEPDVLEEGGSVAGYHPVEHAGAQELTGQGALVLPDQVAELVVDGHPTLVGGAERVVLDDCAIPFPVDRARRAGPVRLSLWPDHDRPADVCLDRAA